MDISIIIPVYNEERNIKILYEQLNQVLKEIDKTYEILFIDDGSTDKTFNELKTIHAKDKNIKIIRFQKNFGKAAALSVGFKNVKGEVVFTMDGDLQDDPTEIPKFLSKLNEGYDLVVGWKYKRHDPITKTIPSKFFNKLTATLTKVKIHDANCGFKAFRKEVLPNLSLYGELHRYIPALVHFKGFKVTEVPVIHHERKFGKSKYGISRLLKGFLDLITVMYLTTYTKRPLHFFGPIGLLSAFFGFVIGAYLVYLRILYGSILGRSPLLMLAVLLIVLGIQFISIGLIGEMVTDIKSDKETYVIREILD